VKNTISLEQLQQQIDTEIDFIELFLSLNSEPSDIDFWETAKREAYRRFLAKLKSLGRGVISAKMVVSHHNNLLDALRKMSLAFDVQDGDMPVDDTVKRDAILACRVTLKEVLE
jgi:hypothetical protein